jgi:two-component system sensor histidine kinase PilS (NtrC family)
MSTSAADSAPFQRLWAGFLTARVMVGLALLTLLLLGLGLNQSNETALLTISCGYLAAAVALRVLARRAPPDPQPGVQWLPSIGVDILLVCCLQWFQNSGSMNFTPLFGLPVLMAAVLGTLILALGATAGVTLLLLAWAWWLGKENGIGNTQGYLDAALTGTGYFVAAYLVHQLAARLVSERQVAHRSQMDARTQTAVSALVIQHVADGVLVLDEAGLVRLANPAALLLIGQNAQMPVQPPFVLADVPAWKPLAELGHNVFGHGEPRTADLSILHEGQSPMGLRVRAWLTAGAAGDGPPLCVMFLHDLREMEARLRTEKLAAMGRMSAAVAHEIRNPLAAIVQANDLLDEELSEPGHKRLSHMIRQNTERLVRITEDVLDIARVQHQIGHAGSTTLALDATVQQIFRDWQAQEPARRQGRLRLEARAAQVAFDPEHLRRVLVNLLDNALRYVGPQPDSLIISTRAAPGGTTSVQVWSDGAPLDKSVQQHMFEPFFSSESRSSGLGLYICRELCERHGASIGYQRATRQLARGQTPGNAFTVTFRAANRPADATGSLFDTIVV